MLFLSLLVTFADATVFVGLECDAPSVITSIGGCLTAEPTLEFRALGQSLTGSGWTDTVVYDGLEGSLDDPGWADAAEWRSSGVQETWPLPTTTVAHTASATEDFFAFEFQVDSGERIFLAGPHLIEVGGTQHSLASDKALLLSCSPAGVSSVRVVDLP